MSVLSTLRFQSDPLSQLAADEITRLTERCENAEGERDRMRKSQGLLIQAIIQHCGTDDRCLEFAVVETARANTAEAALTQARTGELTEEMVNAGIAALGSDDDRQPAAVILDVWRAMHRAATKGEG